MSFNNIISLMVLVLSVLMVVQGQDDPLDILDDPALAIWNGVKDQWGRANNWRPTGVPMSNQSVLVPQSYVSLPSNTLLVNLMVTNRSTLFARYNLTLTDSLLLDKNATLHMTNVGDRVRPTILTAYQNILIKERAMLKVALATSLAKTMSFDDILIARFNLADNRACTSLLPYITVMYSPLYSNRSWALSCYMDVQITPTNNTLSTYYALAIKQKPVITRQKSDSDYPEVDNDLAWTVGVFIVGSFIVICLFALAMILGNMGIFEGPYGTSLLEPQEQPVTPDEAMPTKPAPVPAPYSPPLEPHTYFNPLPVSPYDYPSTPHTTPVPQNTPVNVIYGDPQPSPYVVGTVDRLVISI